MMTTTTSTAAAAEASAAASAMNLVDAASCGQDHHRHRHHNHHQHRRNASTSASASTSSTFRKLVGRLRSNSTKPTDHSQLPTPSSSASPSPPAPSTRRNSASPLPPFHSGSGRRRSKAGAVVPARDAPISLSLWDAAYRGLRDDPSCTGLVLTYEAIISQELPDSLSLGGLGSPFGAKSPEERLDLLARIAAAGLHRRRGSRPSPQQPGQDDEARRMLEATRGTVEGILPRYPSAAVAWAGLCTLTPLLADPIFQSPDMRLGILHIAGRIPWYMCLAQLLLVPAPPDYQESTRAILVRLYRKVLELEMNCVCATAGAWNSAAKNVVGWTSLGTLVAEIVELDRRVRALVEKEGEVGVREMLLAMDVDLDLEPVEDSATPSAEETTLLQPRLAD
ncbi:hypothetical protein RJ55_03841 [Drechmeria coniospora]|nr:hypothetical protein RJ55_03841 [Drechmeria coniospora]